jgi:protein tyrosine/serine phosphatase
MTRSPFRFPVFVLLATATLVGGAGGCAMRDPDTGLANVHAVDPGVLVRGGQPNERGFRTLRDEYGVRVVVNLNDATADHEGKLVESLGMQYLALPSNPFHPDQAKVLRFIQAVREAEPLPDGSSGSGTTGAGGVVYVHCQHGMDRTGYAVAAYRILVDDWTADRAMAELRGYQAFPHAILFPAIGPFVRGVYRDRDTLRVRLTSMPPSVPSLAKAHAPAAGG